MLGGDRLDGGAQFGRQLALLFNTLEHRLAALFQLAQIAQTGLQLTQLNVIQAIRRLFAIAGNEGHRGTTIQQGHGSIDLGGANLELGRNLQQDLVQHRQV